MAQYAHAPHGRQHIPEQFDTFSIRCGSHHRHAGNVSAGPRQACDDAGFDRVSCQYYDGDLACCLLRCQRAGDVECHDHVDAETDQLGCNAAGKESGLSERLSRTTLLWEELGPKE